jgi:hypothetical protein
MGLMTSKPTPCETGNRCKVPKWREELKPLRDDWDSSQYDGITYDDLVEAVDGLCRHETHPDDWFEVPEAGYNTPPFWRTQRAMARCHFECPKRLECLFLGLEEDHGVWGGYSANQRDIIKTERTNISAKRAAAASQATARQEEPDAEKEQAS